MKYEIDFAVRLAYEVEADSPQEAYDKMKAEIAGMDLVEFASHTTEFDEEIEGVYQMKEHGGVFCGGEEKNVTKEINMW